jgi:BlaI family penicillinase repressor
LTKSLEVEEERTVAKPEGKLTPVQFEILQLIWNAEQGLTIGEIWDAIRSGRDVSRTTVLNLVDRLEKRGWLKRRKQQGVFRYTASVERQSVETQLASDFVDEFFDGSAANLMMNLLGSQRISKSEIQRLKRLLDDRASASTRNKGESP